MHHTTELIQGLSWTSIVFASLYGWGSAIDTILNRSSGIGARSCVGCAFSVFIGGILNLVGISYNITVLLFVLIGAIFSLFIIFRNQQPIWKWLLSWKYQTSYFIAFLQISIALIAIFSIVGHLYYPDFNNIDDLPAYLCFPTKMVEVGSLGFEPFSERRLLTSIGGLYFLQAMIISGAPIYFLHAIDPSLGTILILCLLETNLRRYGISVRTRLLILIGSTLYVPNIVNLTGGMLPVPLILFIYLYAERLPRAPDKYFDWAKLGNIFLLSLVAAALVVIRPAFLPLVIVFFGVWYSYDLIVSRSRRGDIVYPLILAALTAIMMLPWMLVHLRDTGTLLYPLFGHGYHASQYGTFIDPARAGTLKEILETFLYDGLLLPAVICPVVFAVLLAGFGSGGLADDQQTSNIRLLSLTVANLLLLLAISVGTGGYGLARYGIPGDIAVFLAALVRAAQLTVLPARETWRPRIGHAIVIVAPILILVSHAYFINKYFAISVRNLAMATLGPQVRPNSLAAKLHRDDNAEQQSVRLMQAAVPAGQSLLERIDYPFLMDFSRNHILIADWPGATSLPPGMPSFRGPEPLADYLLMVGIRYVAYAYASEAGFPLSLRDTLESAPWVQDQAAHLYDFQDNLKALMRSRALIFDDSRRAVIDLKQKFLQEEPRLILNQ